MSAIKVSALWDEVVKVAKEQPDHIYDRGMSGQGGCSYQKGGEPSCIVGHALVRLGMPVEELMEFDDTGDSGIGCIVSSNDDLFEIDDEKALWGVEKAQSNQDNGVPWGMAVKYPVDDGSEDLLEGL